MKAEELKAKYMDSKMVCLFLHWKRHLIIIHPIESRISSNAFRPAETRDRLHQARVFVFDGKKQIE